MRNIISKQHNSHTSVQVRFTQYTEERVLNFSRERVNERYCCNQSDIMTLTCCHDRNRKEQWIRCSGSDVGSDAEQPGARTH